MQLRKTILASVLCAALVLSAAACGTAENAQSAVQSTAQSTSSAAASESAAETATPSPEATPTASPTAEPTAEPTASPAPESSEAGEDMEITAELEAMAPLLEAHILAQMNGMAFDADDPVYFWQTVAFAVDNCGMTFYSAETTGSALTLSRGVIEEIASGLFESAADKDLPEIPDSLSGELSYDADSDTYARPISGGFSVDLQSCVKNGDVYTVTAALIRDENEAEPQAIFTAELVPNPREDNTVFIYSIRTVKQIP